MPFSPAQDDVQRYLRLRAVSRQLIGRMVKTIPKQAYDDIGEAIGVLRRGVLVFETEDEMAVMADCCLYEWVRDGQNLVQRYADTHPAPEGTDERYLLDAHRRAQYRIVRVENKVPGAGVHGVDVLNDEPLFLMDVSLSRGATPPGLGFATRTICLGDYWMTGGAPLPMILNARAERLLRASEASPLMIVRLCLESGAAEHVAFQEAPPRTTPQPVRALTPSRNRRCPCGSGRRYKRCCGR